MISTILVASTMILSGGAYLDGIIASHIAVEMQAKYRAGDPDWDAEADDFLDVEGGGYMDGSKVARDPYDRTEQTN